MGGGSGAAEEYRRRGNEADNQRHHQDAEPEAARADVFDVFARRDEQGFGGFNGQSRLLRPE